MSESAHITSFDAIARFATALRVFEDQASRALTAIDEQAGKAHQWLEHDAMAYWKLQVRKGFEKVAETRTALHTCQMRTYAGFRPSCIDEQKAYRAAQERLRHAEEMIEVVRHWNQRVRRELDEYRGRITSFRRALEGDIPKTLALLERTVATLESYAGSVTEEPQQEDEPSS